MEIAPVLQTLDPARHVVIAGPTASGKSALALAIAEAQGGSVVNADALQVWSCWRVLTARPSPRDEARAPHLLYGHVAPGVSYSVGDWLREVAALQGRLIVTGGTGLYLSALTRGLAPIPPVPAEIRAEADARMARDGVAAMAAALDPESRAGIDLQNPARVQRAWEVLRATGRGIALWQREMPPPLLPETEAQCLVLTSDRDWLAERIARRFHAMMRAGAVDEVAAMRDRWDSTAQWARAIGAGEIRDWLDGRLDQSTATERAIIATRQYAKAQRIWFRGRMKSWRKIAVGPPASASQNR